MSAGLAASAGAPGAGVRAVCVVASAWSFIFATHELFSRRAVIGIALPEGVAASASLSAIQTRAAARQY
jgi:hypothetical protein